MKALEDDDEPVLSKDSSALVLLPSGEVRQYEERGWTLAPPPVAVGSGQRHALTAMDCGKKPDDAVKFAILRDPMSGGPVNWMRCKP